VALFCACAVAARAQDERKPAPPAEESEDEVVRVNADLIQTGVAVFDKKGRFVGGLGLEDFELSVDGKPVSISFFEPSAGRGREGAEAKVARDVTGPGASAVAAAEPAGRGRNILFVVDDLHLSFESHYRVRKLISRFIEQEMRPEDTAVVVSTTGKIGFLQQFTDDPAVLRAAVARLVYARDRSANDRTGAPMTEYEALLISQFDIQVTDIFAAYESGGDLEARRSVVRSRAASVLAYAASINRGVYSTLEQAIRSASQLAGRKVVFFISDGFLLDPANSDSSYRMRRITDAAARTNAVVYSLDAKGLDAGFPEGTTGGSPGVGFRVQSGERYERQDGLSQLARETGGRFIRNTNDLQTGLTKSIEEATQYYLLAWRPDDGRGGSEKLRKIEVRVRNRPDLQVRVQGGYLDKQSAAPADEKSKAAGKSGKNAQAPLSPADRQLNAAAGALVPARSLPVSLTVGYLDLPNEGMSVYIASQIKSEAVEFTPREGGGAQASVDLLGLVYDSDGKRAGFFRELLTVDASGAALSKPSGQAIVHNHRTRLKPGLYQIRVAARDAKSGRVGSAVQWVEVPDLSKRRLALSSLILSEKAGGGRAKQGDNEGEDADVRVMVDRRIRRTSQLRYMVFIYNAARGEAGTAVPDVTIQTQLLRGNSVVLTTPARPISTEGQDPARLAYAAEISLASLPAGRYELRTLVQDRAAKSDSTQRVSFQVE
jgi:VWFA-related protein